MEGWSQAAPREGWGLGLSFGGHCGPAGPRGQEDTPSHWLPLELLSPAPPTPPSPGDSYCVHLGSCTGKCWKTLAQVLVGCPRQAGTPREAV